MKSVQFFPLILWYVWGQNFDFLRKKDQFWTNLPDVGNFFLTKLLQKKFMVMRICKENFPWEVA